MNIKTREQIITDMCYTWRHDYGLDKHPDDLPFVAGMLQSERESLWRRMAQLFDNNIQPYMEFKNETQSQ
jgi:hypothetical protein